MRWDADQYDRFKQERELPFEDVVALIQRRPGLRVIDLGCGTGALTQKLASLLPQADVLGIDSSAEMLAKVPGGLRVAQQTIESFADGRDEYDLVFSHAALHWVDDHASLIPKLMARVVRGGQLVVQVPSNYGHRSFELIAEVAGWRRQMPVLGIAQYAQLLWASGGRDITCYEKAYCHELADGEAIFEWGRGTALLPYVERLPESERPAFIDAVRARFRREWPTGPLLFTFRRTLFAATRV